MADSSTAPHAGLYTGTSGWAYATWKPDFYPATVPATKFLAHYASQLNSVEVNYTFRALPTVKQLENWLAVAPEGFRFSFKAPQRITHFKRLYECSQMLEEFVRALEPVRQAGKLGPLLFQLPPNFKLDIDRLTGFLASPSLQAADAPRIAFEFRHESWFTEGVFAAMRERNAALCIAESDDLATPDVHTADFSCYRLRKDGGYNAAEVKQFAQKFRPLAAEREVFVYFKHEDEPTGPLAAVALRKAIAEKQR